MELFRPFLAKYNAFLHFITTSAKDTGEALWPNAQTACRRSLGIGHASIKDLFHNEYFFQFVLFQCHDLLSHGDMISEQLRSDIITDEQHTKVGSSVSGAVFVVSYFYYGEKPF